MWNLYFVIREFGLIIMLILQIDVIEGIQSLMVIKSLNTNKKVESVIDF